MNKLIVTGKKNALVDALQTVFNLVEREGFSAGGGVALFRHEADAHQYVDMNETIATLRAQNAELIAALVDVTGALEFCTVKMGINPEMLNNLKDARAILAKYEKGADNA